MVNYLTRTSSHREEHKSSLFAKSERKMYYPVLAIIIYFAVENVFTVRVINSAYDPNYVTKTRRDRSIKNTRMLAVILYVSEIALDLFVMREVRSQKVGRLSSI